MLQQLLLISLSSDLALGSIANGVMSAGGIGTRFQKESFSDFQVLKIRHRPEERTKIFRDLNGSKI
jgi:hypothetical protein